MPTRHPLWFLILALAGLLGGSLPGARGAEMITMSDSLLRAYLGRDALTSEDWDAQCFNSGAATVLTRVRVNLFRDIDESTSGTFWVRLYDATGESGSPGTNAIASIAEHQPIASLSSDPITSVVFYGFSIPLQPNTDYFIVVGTNGGGVGLYWGYTNDPVGAVGFPSLFTFTGDGGATWRTPFMNALPQRMRVVSDPG